MVSCKKVTAELSNYLADEVSPELRHEIERHLAHCAHCSVLLDSTKKVLRISGDDRVFEIPVAYSQRIHDFIDRCILSC